MNLIKFHLTGLITDGLADTSIMKFKDLQMQLSDKPVDEMTQLVKKYLHPEPYTQEEICGILNITSDKLKNVMRRNFRFLISILKYFCGTKIRPTGRYIKLLAGLLLLVQLITLM